MHFLSFSPKYSFQYLIICIKVGNVLLMWNFIPKDFSLTRRNYNYTRTLLNRRSLWIFACTLHFQKKNQNAACFDGMADGAGSLLHFIAPHCRRSFSISHLPPPHEATEFLGEGNVGEQSLPIPSPQCHGREGISTRIRPQRDSRTWWWSSRCIYGAGGFLAPSCWMWHPARLHPGVDPACIPAEPCATAGKQPMGQDPRIWGSE